MEKMKNENKIRGRGVQFGLRGGNQNHPKSKNQKKMTLRERGIEAKKLNREKEGREVKKEKRSEIRKRERGEKKEKERETPTRPPTEKPNATTTHPVAPANYIMIFNGPKGKTWPPKIFGRGVG